MIILGLFFDLIDYAQKNNCSDLHLSFNSPPVFRKNGELFISDFDYDFKKNVDMILDLLTPEQNEKLKNGFDLDFCYEVKNNLRLRINVYKQKNNFCAAVRLLKNKIPDLNEIDLPEITKKLLMQPNGLILVTGPTGSGKTTSLAAMINFINKNYAKHILTIEDPIEYIFSHEKSLVHQREINTDVKSFDLALRSALREDPDVILVGEMRDLETIKAVITAAETGHLVLSSLHTMGAMKSINRIIDAYPKESQDQIRTQLSFCLRGIISQVLIKNNFGFRSAAFECLIGTEAILNLIRNNKLHEIKSLMQMGLNDGMNTLEKNIFDLVKHKKINYDDGLKYCNDKSEFEQYFLN